MVKKPLKKKPKKGSSINSQESIESVIKQSIMETNPESYIELLSANGKILRK